VKAIVVGTGVTTACILGLCFRWNVVVSSTLWPLYPRHKRQPLSRSLDVSVSRSARGTRIESCPYIFQPVRLLTELFQPIAVILMLLRCEILTALTMRITSICDVTPCSLVGSYEYFLNTSSSILYLKMEALRRHIREDNNFLVMLLFINYNYSMCDT
jgi:hypothetical protein